MYRTFDGRDMSVVIFSISGQSLWWERHFYYVSFKIWTERHMFIMMVSIISGQNLRFESGVYLDILKIWTELVIRDMCFTIVWISRQNWWRERCMYHRFQYLDRTCEMVQNICLSQVSIFRQNSWWERHVDHRFQYWNRICEEREMYITSFNF